MFAGIVETSSTVTEFTTKGDVFQLKVQRPAEFDDLKTGDSISTNGVCLTVETLSSNEIGFAVGEETLRVTKWRNHLNLGLKLNLERSLRFGDRIHGHLVTGHVDGVGEVVHARSTGGAFELGIRVPAEIGPLVWKKGSIAVNGVSLTVNKIESSVVQLLLLPETVKRTNLGNLKVGDWVNLESDYLAKAVLSGHKRADNEILSEGSN